MSIPVDYSVHPSYSERHVAVSHTQLSRQPFTTLNLERVGVQSIGGPTALYDHQKAVLTCQCLAGCGRQDQAWHHLGKARADLAPSHVDHQHREHPSHPHPYHHSDPTTSSDRRHATVEPTGESWVGLSCWHRNKAGELPTTGLEESVAARWARLQCTKCCGLHIIGACNFLCRRNSRSRSSLSALCS